MKPVAPVSATTGRAPPPNASATGLVGRFANGSNRQARAWAACERGIRFRPPCVARRGSSGPRTAVSISPRLRPMSLSMRSSRACSRATAARRLIQPNSRWNRSLIACRAVGAGALDHAAVHVRALLRGEHPMVSAAASRAHLSLWFMARSFRPVASLGMSGFTVADQSRKMNNHDEIDLVERMMELSDLQVFRTVVEAGGITRAAEKLNRVQSNVTTRIQQLEEQLGVALFIREGKRLHLSPAGKVMLGYAERLLDLAREARESVHDAKPRGLLRFVGAGKHDVGAAADAAQRILPALSRGDAGAADRQRPARSRTKSSPARSMPASRSSRLRMRHSKRSPIYNEELVIIAAAGHPPIRSARDARSQTILVFEHGCPWRKRLEEWFALTGDMPERMIEITSYHAMLGCVVVGMGISLVPRMVLDTFPETHRLSVHPLPAGAAPCADGDALAQGRALAEARCAGRDRHQPCRDHQCAPARRPAWRVRASRLRPRCRARGARAGCAHDSRDPMAHYDVVVCGLGVMGSAALYHLARRGGACSGSTASRPATIAAPRMARPASSASPISSIRPMCRWCAAPMSCGASWRTRPARPLLHVTGIAEIGPPDGALVTGTLAAARLHDIPHELIAAPELMRRYPAFRLPPHYVGVVQPDGGFLEAEAVRASDARRWRNNTARRFVSARRCARSSRRQDKASHRHRRHDHRGRHRHRRRRTVDLIAAAGRRVAAARDAPGHGLVRAAGARRFRARPLPGVPDRKRARHPLRLSAVRRRAQGREASPPRRNGRSGVLRPHCFSATTKR